MTDAEPVTHPNPIQADPTQAPMPRHGFEAVEPAQTVPAFAAGQAMRSGVMGARLEVLPSGAAMPDAIATFLALFLILLTFFIGLTAGASFDVSRVGAVVESVQARFAARGAGGSPVPTRGEIGGLVAFGDREARPADPVFVDAFRTLFAPLTKEGAVIAASADGRVFVEVPQEMVFISGTGAVRRERAPLFDALSALVAGKEAPDDRRLAVTVMVPGGGEALAVTRAVAMGRWLASDPGVARKVSTGTMPADGLGVRFEIYRSGGVS